MTGPLEFRFRSRALAWCRYFPETLELDVCFVLGATCRYLQVPRSVVDGLVTASSAGSYFHRNIAWRYSIARPIAPAVPPKQSRGTAEVLLERCRAAIAPHLPEKWAEPIHTILAATPILVRVVRRRKSKHGDHRVTVSRGYSVITVNASGNPWQFVLTLLHEIAHAHVAHQCAHRAAPHGREWKHAFRQLLRDHLHLFPSDLTDAVSDYSRDPLYSSDSHTALAAALRRHDTLDLRPTVQELSPGQMFSLNGKTVMTKERLLRTWFQCRTTDGRIFRVSPTARVHALYDPPTEA